MTQDHELASLPANTADGLWEFLLLFPNKRRLFRPTRHQSDSTGKICNKSDPDNNTITKMKLALSVLLFSAMALAACKFGEVCSCFY